MALANKPLVRLPEGMRANLHRVPVRPRRSLQVVTQASGSTALVTAGVTSGGVAAPASATVTPEVAMSMLERHANITKYFPTALSVDDFMSRVEVALAGFGFTGDNTIAMTNLCRDEVTQVVKDKIEASWGSSFNTNGLGAVLTCGVVGMKAGLSHSPVCSGGRERYVFFAFPHIAINSEGEVGSISRPGRANTSCACGALLKCLSELKAHGADAGMGRIGHHDPLEPEYSILKARLARRVKFEGLDVEKLDLCSLTKVAERTISDDLEYLIEKAVDPKVADYAVVTGVEIHNWAARLVDGGEPSMEFIAPTRAYVVTNGVKTHLDLAQIPPMSYRQLQLLAEGSLAGVKPGRIAPGLRTSVLQEIPYGYLSKRMGGASTLGSSATGRVVGNIQVPAMWPSVQRVAPSGSNMLHQLERDMGAPTMDSPELMLLNN